MWTRSAAHRAQLKSAGKKLSFTHLIAWAIVQATGDMPVMAHSFAEVDGKPHRVTPGAVSLGLAVDMQRKDGSRSLVVPVIKDASEMSFADFVAAYDELVVGARDNKLQPDAYVGANITLTNPGGIGTVASVPRLMPGQGTIVATGAIGYPPGLAQAEPGKLAELGVAKVMTMTSTYDHRVIQGAESGAFLKRVDELLQGEDGFYDGIFGALGVETGRMDAPDGGAAVTADEPVPAAATPAATAAPDEALLQAVQAATSVVKAHRMHGHLAATLDPLGSAPRGDPALDPETVNLTPELMRRIPASVLRVAVPGETFADALPHLAGDLLRDDRVRDRAHLRPQAARVAAQGDRVRRAPPAAVRRGQARPAREAVGGGGARGLPAQGVPGQEAVLDRGPRRAGADARRDDRADGRQRRPRAGARHGPPRAAERARPHGRAARTSRSSWSSRASRPCPPTPPRPRAAPAT